MDLNEGQFPNEGMDPFLLPVPMDPKEGIPMITPGILYRQLKQKYDVEIIHQNPPEFMISTLPKDQVISITFFFQNGYGASIIRHGGSYGGNDGLFEIAVIKGDRTDWHLIYDTPITNDVIGYLDLEEHLEVVGQIHDLPREVEQ